MPKIFDKVLDERIKIDLEIIILAFEIMVFLIFFSFET